MLKKLINNKKNIVSYVVSLLVSFCGLSTGTSPFGLAVFGAVETIKVPLLIPFILISLVTVFKFGFIALLKFLLSAVAYVGIKAFIKTENSKTNNVAKLLVSTALVEGIFLLFSKTLVYDSLLAVFTTITVGIFYLIFAAGLPAIADMGEERVASTEELLSTGVLISVIFSSFGNFEFFGITLGGIVSILTIMILGWKKGPSIGAASGIAVALILGMMGQANITTVAAYGLSGLLAGLLSRFGKFGAVLGFVLGNILLMFYDGDSTQIMMTLKEITIASVALFMMPKALEVALENVFDYDTTITANEKKLFEKKTIYRLNAVSEVIDGIAGEVNEGKDETIEEVRKFIKTLNENTCKTCENYKDCWKKNYHTMYELVFNQIDYMQEKDEVNKKELKKSICKEQEKFAEGLKSSYQIYKVNQDWQQKMKEKTMQSYKQLKGVSSAINMLTKEMQAIDEEEKLQNLTIEIGVAKTKKNNSSKSGDSYITTKINENKYLIGLSDGMGSGEKASQKSEKVIKMLGNLLTTGMDRESAIELVNSSIMNEDDEVFSTIDATIVDLRAGSTEFIKVGSCPTYIKTGKKVDVIKSANLPAGVLDNIDIDLYDRSLEIGDIIVMVSDGVSEAGVDTLRKELWISDVLKNIKAVRPQRIADIILQEAMDANYGIAQDDMTVIVGLVKEE
ncbi:MAG: SpoIIE family protein phosphatase [Clostridia bacterium]|nr:SpoIIE family protein phosphatase [Clostridia bacterium]